MARPLLVTRSVLAILSIACFELGWSALACSNAGPDGSDASADRDAGGMPDADHHLPFLTELGVSASSPSDSSSPIELVPSFSPSIHDYYMRCSAGTNALTVSMTASPGSSSHLLQPSPSPSAPKQTLALKVDENEAIVAAATDATATVEYWVRCLPHDFPMMRMTRHTQAGAAAPGYYLVGNLHPLSGAQGYAMLLDGNGVPVWYFLQPTGLGVCDVDSVVKGTISFVPTATGLGDVSGLPFELHRISPRATSYAAPSKMPLDELWPKLKTFR